MKKARPRTTLAGMWVRLAASPGPGSRWLGAAALASVVMVLAAPAFANQPPVAGPDQELTILEDETVGVELLGSDPDQDPLSVVITGFEAVGQNPPELQLVDSLGHPVEVGSVLADRQVFLTPLPDLNGVPYATITYRVHDGTVDSANTAVVTIDVLPVNDFPSRSLAPILYTYEDRPLEFEMGGINRELDIYYLDVKGAGYEMENLIEWNGVTLQFPHGSLATKPSSIYYPWPMLFALPYPDACHGETYAAFFYRFREKEGADVWFDGPWWLQSFRVLCVNDPPAFVVAGHGAQNLATFTTLLADDGPYTMPLSLLDVDGGSSGPPFGKGPDPGNQQITIATEGGTVAVDEAAFPGVTFETTPTSVAFAAPLSTANAILATLIYTPQPGSTADILTLLTNDGGSNQGCADLADGPTCPMMAGLRVHITLGAGGAPLGVMPLVAGTGGLIPVDSTADEVVPDGNCTLREAVQAANSDLAVDGCPAGHGADVILLSHYTYPVRLGALPINDDLTIVGVGEAFSRIDGEGSQVFNLGSDSLILRDVLVVGEDDDGDGIRTPIDGELIGGSFVDQSAFTSSRFTDQHLGGTTFGNIVETDGVDLTVTEVPGANGVSISATGSDVDTAEIDPCESGLRLRLTGGESAVVTCSSLGIATQTSFTSFSSSPSVATEPVTVGVDVTTVGVGGAGTVTGPVTIDDGAGASCVGVLVDGSTSCVLTPTLSGERTWTATYGGDGVFLGSAQSTVFALRDATTTTAITVHTPNPSRIGEAIAVGWSVQVEAPAAGPPTGVVTVTDGVSTCSAPVGAGGCSLPLTILGPRTLRASFADPSFVSSQGWASHRVVADTVTTILSDTPDPSLAFEPIDVEIAVSAVPPGAGTPTGEVSVDDGAGATCTATLTAGLGSCTLTPTVAGSRNLTATYAGDDNFEASTATEAHQIDGGPQVLGLAGLAGSAIDDCATVRTATTSLDVTFDGPVVQAEQVTSYLVLAAGPDADFSTDSCGAPIGDDIAQIITGASSDLDPTTPTVTLELDGPLPTGLVRLFACETIEDLAGNPIDGDGDGTGGDPFVTTFRLDPDNLFANGDFDRCPATLSPWIATATAPNAVLPSESEDARSSALSGSAKIVSAFAESSALTQCVELPTSPSRLDLGLEARLDAIGAATATLEAACDFFDAPACAGSFLTADSATTPLGDLAGAWTRVLAAFEPSPTTMSALCSVAVTADDPAEPSFDAYLDRLSLTAALGTTTTITAHTPSPSRVGEPVAVSWTVEVVAPGVGTPTGLVTVSDGGAECSAAVGAGGCSLAFTTAGPRLLNASYAGDGDFGPSQGTTPQVVKEADTATAITAASPDPSVVFQPIEVDVAVSVSAPGAGTPTGEVSVDDGAGASCTATLVAGVGTCMLTPTVLGARNLVAAYLGDGNHGSSSTTEPHLVTDGVAPQVLTVATLTGSAVAECATVPAAMGGFAVTFNEPVEGADQVASYRILAAGPDADFSTDLSTGACGAASGDDVELQVSGVSSDLDPATPTVDIQLDGRVPSGLIRLIVCETVADLGGLALDGDGDGLGGDAWVHTFRVDPGNLFTNGDFDRCPVRLDPWIEVATPPDTVLPSESEDADGSSLSGSARILSAAADSAALAQCVDLGPSSSNRRWNFSFDARLDAFGAATATLAAGCELFGLPTCAGFPSAAGEMSAPLTDRAGAWTRFDVSFESPATNASALCSVVVTPGDPGEPSFDAYLDRLSLREGLFADGFESGDTSSWSLTTGD